MNWPHKQRELHNQQASDDMPQDFLRPYYDVYCLLADADVAAFADTRAHDC